jgi:hypothetical protein
MRRTSTGSNQSRAGRRMGITTGLAAMLAFVAVLALGPAGTSAAPGDNAVVHWNGVAMAAISAGPTPTTLRPPAGSSVLGGMVHGAMYDAVAAVEGGLEPFATGVTAPPGASADAAVAQAARDVLVARVPLQAAAVESAYVAYMATIPDGLAKDGGKAVGAAAAAGMLARQPPGVPVRPRLRHRCPDRVPTKLLRDEARQVRDVQHRPRSRSSTDVREPRRARRRGRGRPRLGRSPLPHDDDEDRQALPPDRARRRAEVLPHRCRPEGRRGRLRRQRKATTDTAKPGGPTLERPARRAQAPSLPRSASWSGSH